LTSELDGGDFSTLRPSIFTPREEPHYPLKRSLDGPRIILEVLEKKNLLLLTDRDFSLLLIRISVLRDEI
jgi:hypothetical protein